MHTASEKGRSTTPMAKPSRVVELPRTYGLNATRTDSRPAWRIGRPIRSSPRCVTASSVEVSGREPPTVVTNVALHQLSSASHGFER